MYKTLFIRRQYGYTYSVKLLMQKSYNVFFICLILVSSLLFSFPVNADEISNRSVQVTSGIPLALTTQTIRYTTPSTSTLGSIEFQYCSNSPFTGTPCVAPVGFDISGVVLTGQTNNIGFTVDIINSSASRVVLTRIPASATVGPNTYTFSNVVNPSTPNGTVYISIAQFGSTDASGPRGDNGAVAFAINGGFNVGAFVPPFLVFCAGITVSLNCSDATGSLVSFGELSTTQTKFASSQFSGATNDPTGYSVIISGQTMTAGNQIIPPLFTNNFSIVGFGQFGINLRSNTVPSVGADPAGAGSAIINAPYAFPNQFRFVNGEQLVNSTLPTDYNLHTVSYIVNISISERPGYYASTMTFIATAAF
jgi:hypothetical protein